MAESYERLLGATIRYVEQLRDRGVRYVAVSPDLLASLSAPVPAAVPHPRLAEAGGAGSVPPRRPITRKPAAAAAPPAQADLGLASADAVAPAQAQLTTEARIAAMTDLRTRALACRRCPNLAAARRNVVFGVGDMFSPLLFVGEAPGADEDEQGEPFVGRAGQLLTRIIETMGLSRSTVYIANILKCRPDTPGQTAGNRKPTAEEMKTCFPYLHEQIDLIQPKVIVALGATAVEGLFGRPMPITRTRGQWQEFRRIPVMPTYHPAYLLRNQSMHEKRRLWEDMLQVMQRLGMPVTEKQRGFFLTKP